MNLQARITALKYELQALLKDVATDKQARRKLQVITHQANAMLETPPEIIWRLSFQVTSLSSAQKMDDCKMLMGT